MANQHFAKQIDTGNVSINKGDKSKAEKARHCSNLTYTVNVCAGHLVIEDGILQALESYKNIRDANNDFDGLNPYGFKIHFTVEAINVMDKYDVRRPFEAFIYLQHQHDVDPHSRTPK